MAFTGLYKLDVNKLVEVFDHMHLKPTPYVWGEKAPSMTCDSSEIKGIDCSGFSRYAICKASDGVTDIGDGSQQQMEWFEGNPNNATEYRKAGLTKDRLFIAFIKAANGHPGHVWFVLNGFTMESHGGVGVSSRVWDTPVLMRGVAKCYLLGAVNP